MSENIDITDPSLETTAPAQNDITAGPNSRFDYLPIRLPGSGTNNVSNDEGAEYVLRVEDTSRIYYPQKSYLTGKFYLVKDTDESYYYDATATNLVSTIANGAQTFFRRVKFVINNTNIEDVNYADRCATIMKYVSMSKSEAESSGTSEMFYLDTTNTATPSATGDNEGYVTRWQITQGRSATHHKYVEFTYVPPLGFFHDQERPLYGVKFDLHLERNNDASILHSSQVSDATHFAAKFKLHELTWWLPYQVPSNPLSDRMSENWTTGQIFKYPFSTAMCFRIPWITTDISSQILSIKQRPSKIFLAFQRQTAQTSQLISSALFTHDTIKSVYLRVGETRYPETAYENLDWSDVTSGTSSSSYIRSYADLMRMANKMTNNNGCLITRATYASLFPMFCFNTKNTDFDAPYLNSAETTISIEAHRTEGTPTTPDLHIFLVAFFDCLTEIQGPTGLITKTYSPF